MNRIRTTAHRNRLQAFSAAILVGMTALTGAAWMTLTMPSDDPVVVQLERVVVTGVRTPDPVVAQLPRVVIEGKRNALADGAQVASACTAPAVC